MRTFILKSTSNFNNMILNFLFDTNGDTNLYIEKIYVK